MSDGTPSGGGWDPKTGPFRDKVVAIDFVADAGKLMLESSTSVSEIVDRLRDFLPRVGLEGCALDATMSSLIISYWAPGEPLPITTMREVSVSSPRLELLSGADALLTEVEDGDIILSDAADRLRHLEDRRPSGRWQTKVASLVSAIGWVIFVDGLNLLTIVVAVAAVACTFPIDGIVRHFRLPRVAVTFLIATVVSAIPNLLAAAGASLLVGPAVIGALYMFLPGRAFVSSVIDGLSNAPLSSLSRGTEALATAGFLALGMLLGNRIGTGLGLSYELDATRTPFGWSLLGAAVGVLGLAIAWSMPTRQLAPAVGVGVAGWLIVALFSDQSSGSDWPVYAIAASVVGVLAAFASELQSSPASVYSGVAILPLTPGFLLYAGMLGIAQGDSSSAWSALGDAGAISLAIAVGVAIGLGIGSDSVAGARHITRQLRR